METSRPLQHSSITLIGSDHYSIAPCLHSLSVALSHCRSRSQKWIFDINSNFTLFPLCFFFLFVSFFVLFFIVFSQCLTVFTWWQKCVGHSKNLLSHLLPTFLPLSLDYDGGGPDVLYAIQIEDMSQVREQHQCWRLQLQLLPTQNRALCRYVPLPILLGFFFFWREF